jgi:predicted ATP-dependent endonuclease of OLD family
MKMLKFRVQNYKKAEDSGWIHTENITAFVGKNEAGKSAIFRGLSKLNPSDHSKYDGLKEFPRRRYTAEFSEKSWPISSVEFDINEDERSEISEINSCFSKITTVTVTRYYDNKYSISYYPTFSKFHLSRKKYVATLNDWKNKIEGVRAPEGKGETLQPLKESLISTIVQQIKSLNDNVDYLFSSIDNNKISEVFTQINSLITEEWQGFLFKKIIDENKSLIEKSEINSQLNDLFNWVLKNMPEFIYFDRYDVLDSAIHIDDFIRHLTEDSNDPRLRITKCLFEHVGLDIEKIRALDPNDDKKTKEELERMADERAIQMSAASHSMTEQFTSWWEQRKHRFRYQIDGKNFRVWVSDDLDDSEIELDQRSAGMQYFFSFYLVFLVEARGEHSNSILLLDEPGLQFHGTAQQKTVEFLNKISQKNQLLYTTHSPFMIDGDHLENVKIVFEDKNNFGVTKVSDNIWPKDKDSLFPLQAGLGYSLAQTLFYSKYQLVVEGLTDYILLKSMNRFLSQQNRQTLNKDIVISPAGGTKNIMPLASMLVSNDIHIAVLLDGDEQGIQKQKSLEGKLSINGIMTDEFTGKTGSEIEDFFDDSLYIDAVQVAYPEYKIEFISDEEKIFPIIDRIESMFKRKKYKKLEKWKVSNIILDWITNPSSGNKISDDTCNKFEKLYKHVNKILGKQQ